MDPAETPARICLVTSHNIYGSPRLVSQADALVDAGYEVRVVASRSCSSKSRFEDEILRNRTWTCRFVDWSREGSSSLFWKTGIRHNLAERALSRITRRFLVAETASGRITSELTAAAKGAPADLLIGRGIPALPAVVRAARALGCPAGFDAEDYHSRMWLHRYGPSRRDSLFEFIERKYLPQCDYLFAAAPLIAELYEAELGRNDIGTLLNVFPLSDRPPTLANQIGEALTLYWFSQTIGRDRGLETVVEAMGRIPDVPVELHLRGDWQPGYRAELIALVRRWGLGQDRIVAHSPGPPGEMVRLASSYHVGLALENPVSVNRDICLTNKIFTYMLAGNALVVTKTTAQEKLAREIGEGVFLFDPSDAASLATQLKSWHEDRAELWRARARSWELGTTRYNWEREKIQFLYGVQNVLDRTCRKNPVRCAVRRNQL